MNMSIQGIFNALWEILKPDLHQGLIDVHAVRDLVVR